ncbi:ATP-dependent helicase [Aeromonas salmonicida]|uniref:ATP-dependent helicase n=1 Tax=Aeromonas salmonicida TaxID=645 RepID=UPI00073BDD37|nr:ATP-dependent helicase [Aeromonas salmonicida]KTA80922.1 DNA helicase [Aeromonas salmonicida]MDE7528099.1 ATP-dependent helicase [Aeromonas salmonicida]MDE7532467.1 ATP-dependent helicase [Aeromonas salmonicida]
MTKRLTWEQKSIVGHDTGHALVKAVPGSGKTTTLVKRIERLVKTGTAPRSILILMYNKSAQENFTEKLNTALKSGVIPEIRTFHSLALTIVGYGERRQLIKKKNLITPTDYQYEQLVKQAYRYGFDYEASYIDPNEIETFELFISRWRAAAVTPVDAANDPTFNSIKREFIHAYSRYCELLEENCLRTFDDCLVEAVALLRKDSSLGAHFKHIIVDEYQDVNWIQHEMTRLLSKQDTSVMAVGDVNQCIYEWRGARPDFIGGLFEQHYQNTKVFQLSCTFRFGHKLSLIANSVIRRNSTKLTKLCVSHPSTPKTEVRLHFDNCLSKVLSNLSVSSGTQAILSRTKANLAEAEIALRLCGLPYRYLNGSSALHTRTEIGILVVGVLLSVYGDLRLLENHPNKKAIIYGFLKEAGFNWQTGQLKAALSGLMAPHADLWTVLGQIFDGAQYQKDRLGRLATICQKDGEETPAIDVLRRLGMEGFIDNVGSDGVTRTGSNDRQRGVVRIVELLDSSKIDSRTFLKLILNPKEAATDCEPFILSTLHGSKGLEWDKVILIGLNEQEFPGGKTDDLHSARTSMSPPSTNENIEEERRLFYVGITRTKQQLNLVAPLDEGLTLWLRNHWDSTPKKPPIATRFVYEAGLSACAVTSDAIYNNTFKELESDLSKFHQWYLRDLQRLKV